MTTEIRILSKRDLDGESPILVLLTIINDGSE